MKNLLKPFLILILLTSLTNCISGRILPLSEADSSVMHNKTLTVIHNKKPNFGAITFGNMMFTVFTGGILGFIKMTYDGNKIIKQNDIEDPANIISIDIASKLKSKYNLKIIDDKTEQNIDDINKITEQYREKTDYVLDVRTMDWNFGYIKFKNYNFEVRYLSRLRLIDVKSNKVVAEVLCKKNPSQREINNPPTYDELLMDNAAILKEELRISGSACIDLFNKVAFKS